MQGHLPAPLRYALVRLGIRTTAELLAYDVERAGEDLPVVRPLEGRGEPGVGGFDRPQVCRPPPDAGPERLGVAEMAAGRDNDVIRPREGDHSERGRRVGDEDARRLGEAAAVGELRPVVDDNDLEAEERAEMGDRPADVASSRDDQPRARRVGLEVKPAAPVLDPSRPVLRARFGEGGGETAEAGGWDIRRSRPRGNPMPDDRTGPAAPAGLEKRRQGPLPPPASGRDQPFERRGVPLGAGLEAAPRQPANGSSTLWKTFQKAPFR